MSRHTAASAGRRNDQRRAASRSAAALGSLCVGLYLGLLAMGASCALDHAKATAPHDHRQVPTSSHTSVCAWACQAVSSGSLAAGTADLVCVAPGGAEYSFTKACPLEPGRASLRARAPPA